MLFLVDTSVWTQSLLGQTDAAEASAFIDSVPLHELSLTDFAWHSVGITCGLRNRMDLFLRFSHETVSESPVVLLILDPADMPAVVAAMQQYGLDFDDAYEYIAAEKHGLELVALDRDFAKTPRGYRRPAEVTPPGAPA